MPKLRDAAAILFVGLLLAPSAAYAQASIAGVVKDASGAVLPGVTVEAASPALIERTRSVATDGTGQYKLVDLRPGTYEVTFTLPGFNTIKREGIELTGSFTASVSAEMRVGAIEETITVTAATPIVDVQNVTKERVLNHEVIDALPTGRLATSLANLIPGVSTTSGQDVGGALGVGNQTSMLIHGGKTNDMRTTVNGISYNTMGSFGSTTPALPNMSSIQEVTIDTAAVSAERGEGGVRINFIPKDGGNQFKGTMFGSFANSSMQGSNFTQELKDRGLTTPDTIRRIWDINPGFGGPVSKNRLWFYASVRYNGAGNYAGGMFYNLNANNPSLWTYAPDTSRPASNDTTWRDGQARLTWQANPKNKIGLSYDQQYICRCLATVTATLAPEASLYWYFPLERGVTVDYSSPVTNRVLVEAVMHSRIERYIMERPRDLNAAMIGVVDQFNNLGYRAAAKYGNNYTPNFYYRTAVSYITGAHAIKVGFNDGNGSVDTTTYTNQPLSYRVSSATGAPIPNQITLNATPFRAITQVDHDLGLFAQDKWTVDRLTTIVGLRFDYFASSFPQQQLGPAPLTPLRNFTFAAQSSLAWKDLTPKFGASYDLFGNGKTALKVSLSKYVAGQGATGGLSGASNPVNTLVLSTTRAWTDRNGNFIADCDLLNPAAQTVTGGDICGAMANANFGNPVPGTTYDPAVMTGWGHRSYNWEFSTGVQHEILPRVSVDVSYFRRWYGNFTVTDNLTVNASDYTTFSLTSPPDPRLPGGGAYPVSGLFDLVPAKFGLPAANYVTFASNYGNQIEHWNGVDITVNARPRSDFLVAGGISTGRTVTDSCEVTAKVPEALLVGATWTPQQYCHQETIFLPQVKLLGTYMVPKVDVQLSATFQSLAGPAINANYAAPNAAVLAAIGRNLSAGSNQNLQFNLISPGTLYGDRLNQVDLRFAKIVKFRATRTAINFDLYNALNASPVLTQNDTFSVWQRPSSILTARFARISAQFDF